MPRSSAIPFQSRQQGGLTIIMALVLVSVLGAAVFSLSRNVVRELSMGGTVIQGEKAAAAADAGLDWVITWGQGHMKPADYGTASATGGEVALVTALNTIMAGTNMGVPVTITGATDPSRTISNGGAAATTQTFDIQLQCLGAGWGNAPAGGTGGLSSDNNAASGYKKGGQSTSTPVGWRILATGHATPVGTGQTYQAQRELIATFPY